MGERTVLISGASTGIGRATALRLAGRGLDVLAGVRRAEDGEALEREAPGRIRPVILDVADQATIVSTAETVRETAAGRGLAGLVNNAGITVQGPLEYLAIDDLRRQLEVNVVGHVAVTQAMLPFLRAARGRIVNVGSVGGRISRPFIAPYNASKFAIRAITDSLRKELRPWGIEVVLVEPGAIATPIWDKGEAAGREVVGGLPPEGRERYGESIESMTRFALKTGRKGLPPEAAAEVVERALTADRPRTRYLLGRDARAQVVLNALLPDRWSDALEARVLGIR
ncbi:MAG TPA: SDR family oxidoreductase [Thermoleophilaceae bacterium]|jgi:NAD(P)-dependent dehydrogenase (short-subunit alcohol dehydrogenase family)